MQWSCVIILFVSKFWLTCLAFIVGPCLNQLLQLQCWFSNATIPSTFIRWHSGLRKSFSFSPVFVCMYVSVSLNLYIYVNWKNVFLSYSVDYNSLLSSFILMLKFFTIWSWEAPSWRCLWCLTCPYHCLSASLLYGIPVYQAPEGRNRWEGMGKLRIFMEKSFFTSLLESYSTSV